MLWTDFFDFAPFRSLHDSYGFAHMQICCDQKHIIFPMFFNNSAFCCYAGFKNRAPTNGFEHFFKASSVLHYHWVSHFPNEFLMFSFERCLTLFLLSWQNGSELVATWFAQRRSCSRNVGERSVWRTLYRAHFQRCICMLKNTLCFPLLLTRRCAKPRWA